MQPVRQLDEDHAQVLRHGNQHLAQVFRLGLRHAFRGFLPGDLAQLGDALHQHADLRAELRFYVVQREGSILGHIVQQGSRQRSGIQLQVCQYQRSLQRVLQEGIARLAQLPLMRLGSKMIGSQDQIHLLRRQIPLCLD